MFAIPADNYIAVVGIAKTRLIVETDEPDMLVRRQGKRKIGDK